MERKRHLGNDIAVIIYIESNDDEYPMGAALSFDPSNIKSKFNRILKLVKFYVSRMHTVPPHTYMYTLHVIHTQYTTHTYCTQICGTNFNIKLCIPQTFLFVCFSLKFTGHVMTNIHNP